MIPFYARSVGYAVLLLIPVFTFGIYVWQNAVNVPYADDEALIYTLNNVHDRPGELLRSLFHQHNDHRIFFSRLASVIIHFFSGTMNFRTMIIFGYLNLILLGQSFFLIYRSFRQDFTFFLPVSLLLFSPIVYCTQLWSVTAFEQSLSIAFSLYCLYFLQQEKQKIWYISLPFAMAAALANLDGISVIPIALFWLIIQKRKVESLIFGLFSVLYCYVFFLGFRFSSASRFPDPSQLISVVLKGFVALCGSIVKVVSDSYGYQMAVVLGAFILITYIIFTTLKFFKVVGNERVKYQINLTEICFFKVLACVLMIALGRSGDDAGVILSIRFQIYSASIFVMFYLFVLNNLTNFKLEKLFFAAFLTTSLALNLLAYAKYQNAVKMHNEELIVDSFNYPQHGFFVHQYFRAPDPKTAFYNPYKFPVFFKTEVVSNWISQLRRQKEKVKASLKMEILRNSTDFPESLYPIVRFELSNLPSIVPQRDIYLALLDKNNKTLLIAIRPPMPGWINQLLGRNIPVNFLTVAFPKKMAGDFYDVALCWTNNNIPHSLLVARNININPK
ncbi:hypothetical protein L0657_20175 [Dyadobacter sp. CY345]|uniref:hypothetical protein n=1 Tax=Dyadobacter sp. CY345 TaxID=2909335 RepID=UPI001F3E3780|nr:hypothetical protein [Dyadobacter sp. CY345]MCF2446286.1 hypothetical protein [Dyadobacter sp. CY345]